jgi:hypothetical protein
MNNTLRTQDLREAFSSIITMILGLLRAHGLRGLIYLPSTWLLDRELRRIADEFCQLFATWQAGLPPRAVPAQPPATPRVRAARPSHAQSPRARKAPLRRPVQPARAGAFARPHSIPDAYLLPAGILVSARST